LQFYFRFLTAQHSHQLLRKILTGQCTDLIDVRDVTVFEHFVDQFVQRAIALWPDATIIGSARAVNQIILTELHVTLQTADMSTLKGHLQASLTAQQ